MVVCQYFLRGTCKFGSSCRNEHPAGGQQPTFGSTGNTWLRQGTGGSSTKTNSETSLPYDAQTMANDMTQGKEKPMWPLSSYGPGKQEICLITGLDESAEELRVKAYLAIKAGNLNEYLTYEAKQISTADQTFANVRANSTEAFEKSRKQSAIVPYVEPANTNTTSAFGTTTSSAFPSTSSAFGTQPTTSAFGTLTTAPTASVFGTPAFGQPAFGQPSFGQAPTAAPAVSAFGQPAQTTTSTSVFGQPSQPTTTSAFGQTSQPASVFGQPSFGQPAPNNPLIKPASGAFSAFSGSGPSAFGAAASTPSSNTANSTTGGGGGAFSAFAGNQPSAFGLLANNNNTTSVFGQPSFGQPAPNANANQTSVFGAPSAFGQQQQQQPTSVFGNTNPTTNVFGGAPSTSVFGGGTAAPSVFGGGGAATPSVFGGGGNTTSVFGAGAPTTSVFGGGGAAPSPFGQQQQQQQQQDPMSLNAPQPQVTSTPSIAMSSSSQSSSSMKTNGPLDLSVLATQFPYQPGATPYDGLLPENYMELVPQTARELFLAERFEWGKGVPEWVPPVEVR